MADVTISGLSEALPNKNSAIIPFSDGSSTYKTSPSGIVAASPGSVLQVKHTLFTNRFNMSSTTFAPVFSASITPISSNSNILVHTSALVAFESWQPGPGVIGINRFGDGNTYRVWQRPNAFGPSVGDTPRNPMSTSLQLFEMANTTSTIHYQFIIRSIAQGYNSSVNTYADGSNETTGQSMMTVWEIAG